MDIHIRTKISSWWSSIEYVAIKIGDDTLEVTGGTDGGKYWLNGIVGAELEDGNTFALSGFKVTFRKWNIRQKKYRIDFGNGGALLVETYKDFVSVNVKANHAEDFIGAVGMMGKFSLSNQSIRCIIYRCSHSTFLCIIDSNLP